MNFEVLKFDITEMHVDAIVNAANTSLLGGGGVDGAIHRKGGKSILEACQTLRNNQGGCAPGEAVITTAGKLAARYVIHTVGPVWTGGQNGEREILAKCYHCCINLCQKNSITTIAFPSLSTGRYGFPKEEAAMIAIKSINSHLSFGYLKKVIFSCYDSENYKIYNNILNNELF